MTPKAVARLVFSQNSAASTRRISSTYLMLTGGKGIKVEVLHGLRPLPTDLFHYSI